MEFIDETQKNVTFDLIKIGSGFSFNDCNYIKISDSNAFNIATNEIKTVKNNLKVHPRKVVIHIY